MKKFIMVTVAILLFTYTFPANGTAEDSDIQEQTIYSILVDRFNNGDQAFSEEVRLDDPYAFHGGDIKGIQLKLDELKDLGFTTISLSPIMENATDGYHGYWIEDYYTVEEQFGTMDDLKKLVKEAHKRDMKVMLELVNNYVANSNPIVTDATKSDWILPNEKADATNEPWLNQVVVLNQSNPEVQNMLIDVAKYWLEETDVDGFTLHAADQSDSGFLEKLTSELKKEKEDLYLVADVLSNKAPDTLLQIHTIDVVENPELSNKIIEVLSHVDYPVSDIFQTWEKVGNEDGLIYVDNKVLDRFAQVAGENGRDDVNTWQLALTYLLTSPGVSSIFQGSEIPMYGAGIEETEKLVDFNSGDPDLKEVYSKILSLRTNFPALQYGDFELVESDHGMSVFKRSYQDQTMYIAINNDSVLRSVSIKELDSDLQLRGLLGDDLVRQLDNGDYKISLKRESVDVYIIEENSGINWVFVAPIVIVLVLFLTAVIYLGRKQKKRENN
jgi:cyclomaltodextrinase / maltogenic alpha-amylase / neopullulanase